ncbi:hypothetical protein [Streptomyces sp. NPDC056544]|uniref:hypothetical protein n=1 Tax=unclassified Streptomyces TaxID=2593676 RepID=UPI0036BE1C72
MFIHGPNGAMASPTVTLYRDGSVGTSGPKTYAPCESPQQRAALISLSDQIAQRSPAVRALEARQAALTGLDDLLESFATDVLGLWRSTRWMEAVSTALLGDWVQPLHEGMRLDETSVARLRADAQTAHRHLTPVWRRRTRHGRVLLLDTPLGDGLTLYDLAAGTLSPGNATLADIDPDNARLASLIRALLPAERTIAMAWAHPQVSTWTEAAQHAGADEPTAAGERVRRKVRRIAAELERRQVQAVRGPGSRP